MSAATRDESMIANVDRAYEALTAMVCDLGDKHHPQVDVDDVLAAFHAVFIMRNELRHAGRQPSAGSAEPAEKVLEAVS